RPQLLRQEPLQLAQLRVVHVRARRDAHGRRATARVAAAPDAGAEAVGRMTTGPHLMKLATHLVAIGALLALCGGSPAAAQAARPAQRQGRGAERGVDPENPGVTP